MLIPDIISNMATAAPKRKTKHCIIHFYKSEGVSLVEVVIAIGLISFAMVPLMGLMPGGMNIHRSASDDIALGLIRKDLSAKYRSLGFSNLSGILATNSFYSINGEPVSQDDQFAVYEVKLSRNETAEISPEAIRMVFEISKNGRSNSVIAITLPNDGT